MSKETFISEVNRFREKARTLGCEYVDVLSKDVHSIVGGYPGPNHQMPSCCDAMRALMKPGDVVMESPKSGKGASLKIRYFL